MKLIIASKEPSKLDKFNYEKNIIIGALVVAIIAAGALFFLSKSAPMNEQPGQTISTEQGSQANGVLSEGDNNAVIALSEKPDSAKFDEYFNSLYLGTIAQGETLGYGATPRVSLSFVTGKDQFCTAVEPKKKIAAGTYASAIYDVNTKTYVKPKTIFPGAFEPMLNAGCGSIPAMAGKYEYKAYLGNTLVMVLPFEIK